MVIKHFFITHSPTSIPLRFYLETIGNELEKQRQASLNNKQPVPDGKLESWHA
jgi:hypothetical protein